MSYEELFSFGCLLNVDSWELLHMYRDVIGCKTPIVFGINNWSVW